MRPSLMLGLVTFDEHVNTMKRPCKGDISVIYKVLITVFLEYIKGSILRSDIRIFNSVNLVLPSVRFHILSTKSAI